MGKIKAPRDNKAHTPRNPTCMYFLLNDRLMNDFRELIYPFAASKLDITELTSLPEALP